MFNKLFTVCFCLFFVFEYGCSSYKVQLPPECVHRLEEFAKSASNFTLCSIMNARPIRLCEQCVLNYVQFTRKYQELLSENANGTSCQEFYISQDRLEAVKAYHDNILGVWTKSNCNDCFEWGGTNSYPEISNKTKKFNIMFNETMQCILSYNFSNHDLICDKCKQSYLELDEFYKSMSKDKIGVECVCMDVVDSMNTTRSIWSKELECCKIRNNPEVLFLCSTAVISLLPVLFYLSMRYCGPIRDLPNALRQTRFKQTFLRSRNTQTNQRK